MPTFCCTTSAYTRQHIEAAIPVRLPSTYQIHQRCHARPGVAAHLHAGSRASWRKGLLQKPCALISRPPLWKPGQPASIALQSAGDGFHAVLAKQRRLPSVGAGEPEIYYYYSIYVTKQTGPVWRVYVMHVATRDQHESDQPDVGVSTSPTSTRATGWATRETGDSARPFLTQRIAAVTSRQSEGEMTQVSPARKRKNDGS